MAAQVAAALCHVDAPAVVVQVSSGTDARRVPKRRRPEPTVAVKRRKQAPPWWGRLVLIIIWATDVPQVLYDAIADSLTLRRRRRPLRGGWRSHAGGLLAACDADVRKYLAVGRSEVHLVYVGDLGSEVGWSLPRKHVRSAESLKWAEKWPHMAHSRLHFVDGSWAGLLASGQDRAQLLSQVPSVSGR
ncbi:hypothetical protein RM572_15825 [Streptomyces sp. DSM 42041]|uniref:Uncharacterized protein n=1 Tax=Streptomyces hazeniae TaxID=3075538 RepID=A0ABU2NUD2_9ACTN|nr:hypothetical protein [Streptomyces sp. DSM 42041]MDT0380226.1 hypothetical protein [Streptomyces sp. DSM 42041]